ncbi:MAG: bifunctional 4-hydroxy-2-oxoglutarate aldolase/2-dehydro-3-deoxy-phosphogluconate aldolase [Symbiobacterium sp.]|uniref:bifunctional 4-hydroxy-2-oxoglutarate aldolase/2-dehydro-3-deoxy-phosphogluconate aldolase n=1 Tax=Symbiobacterium sp. TaxID=1971213 RepID=UPI0034649B93
MSLVQALLQEKVIAIVRGIPAERADHVAEALRAGGIRFIEVTMNTPGAIDILRQWRRDYAGKMFVGAGTVLNQALARQAIDAGAEFLVTPNVKEAVIQEGIAAGVDVYPGAMTPTEIAEACECGAQAVKVFPAGSLGSRYFKELQGPLGHIPMIAVGGIGLENMSEYARAGARAFGMGGSLVRMDWVLQGDYARLREHARAVVQAARDLQTQ